MRYGYFSEDSREYIITRPDTPRPWVNYLFNDSYHAIISQTAGGFSYCRDPKFNRIHRYERMLSDRPGRYLFLRDEKTMATWSATWQPMMRRYQKFRAVHGLGYTSISSQYFDIATQLTFFVPPEDACEVCLVEITNRSTGYRELKLFPYIDFVAGDAQMEIDYPNIMSLYNRAGYYSDLNAIIAYKQPHPTRQVESYAWFATSEKVHGYDCSRETFLGRYGELVRPQMVLNGACTNSSACGEDMIGLFEQRVTLSPGEKARFVLLTGFIDNDQLPPLPALQKDHETFLPFLPSPAGKEKIQAVISRYLAVEKAEETLQYVKNLWRGKTDTLVIETPDTDFDRMTNLWGKYQLYGITHWRGTSAYHSAEGGLGYRDTAQDAEGILSVDTALARKKIENLLRFQYPNGHAVSGFSEKEGSWEEQGQATVTGKSDMAVWLVYAVVAYLEETGDFSFLEQDYAFLGGESGTVWQHCLRAIEHLTSRTGAHGLPLIGKADWNDAYDQLGHRGKGETVWLGMAVVRALKKMMELATFRDDARTHDELFKKAEKMKSHILQYGWDGKWFIAAINDLAYRVGSEENAQGKLPLNSQTWAILSGIVDHKRGMELIGIVDKLLDTPYGPALFSPVYENYHPGIGRVCAFAPGTKENAAVFSHAAAFKIVADCLLKRGNAAYETFCKIMPGNPAKADLEKYKVEPYIYAEYIVGPGHPTNHGEGAFTWNTGTAPWMFMAATEWICGARRTLSGLLIDPCIPDKWRQFSIVRPFRNAIYRITVENPHHVQSGVISVKVDDEKIDGNLITPHSDGREHKVEVLMG